MGDIFERTRLLLGTDAMERLRRARVIVFGVGGVGGYAVEALARSGVGAIDVVDNDRFAPSNLNRQILATAATLGQYKVDAARDRILSINPDCAVTVHRTFYLPETEAAFDFTEYDYVLDAIDTVAGKLALIVNAQRAGTPIISSMGAGNKLDPTAFRVADIYDTAVCPLARVIRTECRKRGVRHLKVVYSQEPALRPLTGVAQAAEETAAPDIAAKDAAADAASGAVTERPRRSAPGSVAFVPSVAGLIMAGEVVRDLTRDLLPHTE